MTVELALLSRVSYGGLEITRPRLQDLLALLAEDPRAGCSASRLLDALWSDEPPEHPLKALQVLVARARARLGPGVIVSTPDGYRLGLRDDTRCRSQGTSRTTEFSYHAAIRSARAARGRNRAGPSLPPRVCAAA